MRGTGRQFGEGPLSRVASFVYTVLVVEVLLIATTLPGLVGLIFLAQDASNVPLAALCALPVGPALSAAFFALRNRNSDLTELAPAAAFFRGYRLNVVGALKIWVPLLAFLTIVGVTLTHRGTAGVPAWWAAILVALTVVVALWAANAMVITSLFAFRGRDVARLAVYFLARTPLVALGNAGVLLVAVALTAYVSEVATVLAGALLALLVLQVCQPMITIVRDKFTA